MQCLHAGIFGSIAWVVLWPACGGEPLICGAEVGCAPEFPEADEDHIWCAEAAPWLFFTFEGAPAGLQSAVESGACEVIGASGVVEGAGVRWLGDGVTCEGLRVFGLPGAGRYRVECAGIDDTGEREAKHSVFGFIVGADTCPVGDLDGASVRVAEGSRGEVAVWTLPRVSWLFYDAGGLVRDTLMGTEYLRAYLPIYYLPFHCAQNNRIVSLQLLQPDGTESEVVEVALPCDEVETGCASTGRCVPGWLALLGLPLVLARRRA